MISDEYKSMLEKEQEKIEKELGFPITKKDFSVYNITVHTSDKGMGSLGKRAFISRLTSRLVSSYKSINLIDVSDAAVLFIHDIVPCDTENCIANILISPYIRVYEKGSIQYNKYMDMERFVNYIVGLNNDTAWYNDTLSVTSSVEHKDYFGMPCWFADTYRKIIVGNQVMRQINEHVFTNGDCIRFACLFKMMFGALADPVWATNADTEKSHVFTYLFGRFYDALGSYDYVELKNQNWIFEYPKLDTSLEDKDGNSVFNFVSSYNIDAIKDILLEESKEW